MVFKYLYPFSLLVLSLEVRQTNANKFPPLTFVSRLYQTTDFELKLPAEQNKLAIFRNEGTDILNLHRILPLKISVHSNLNEHLDDVDAGVSKKVERNDQDTLKDNTKELNTLSGIHALPVIESKSGFKHKKAKFFTVRASLSNLNRPISRNNGLHSILNQRFNDVDTSVGKKVTRYEDKEMKENKIARQGILQKPPELLDLKSKPFIKPNTLKVISVLATGGNVHRIAPRNVGVHSVLNERLDDGDTAFGKNVTKDEEKEIQKARITVISSCSLTLMATAIFIAYVYFSLKSKRLAKIGVTERSFDRTSILR